MMHVKDLVNSKDACCIKGGQEVGIKFSKSLFLNPIEPKGTIMTTNTFICHMLEWVGLYNGLTKD